MCEPGPTPEELPDEPEDPDIPEGTQPPAGKVSLLDLFEGCRQLITCHFRFHPQWEDGYPSCTAGADEVSPGLLEHLHTRDYLD